MSASTETLTAADLTVGLRAATSTLRSSAGTEDLAAALVIGLEYGLGPAGQAALDELSALAFLAGLPHLPCCSAHPDELEVFTAALNAALIPASG